MDILVYYSQPTNKKYTIQPTRFILLGDMVHVEGEDVSKIVEEMFDLLNIRKGEKNTENLCKRYGEDRWVAGYAPKWESNTH
jgi:hypothetical protein